MVVIVSVLDRDMEDPRQLYTEYYDVADGLPTISPSVLESMYCRYIIASLNSRSSITYIRFPLRRDDIPSVRFSYDSFGPQILMDMRNILDLWYNPSDGSWQKPPFEVIVNCILTNIESTRIDKIDVVADQDTDYGFIIDALYNVDKPIKVDIGLYRPKMQPHYFFTNNTGKVEYYVDPKVVEPRLRKLAILMEPGITRHEPPHPLRGFPTDIASRIKSMMMFSRRRSRRRNRRHHRYHRGGRPITAGADPSLSRHHEGDHRFR